NSSSFKLSDDGTGHLLIKDPPATIADGATLTVAAASSFDAAFADSTGTLVLSDPTHFTGTISAASGTLSSGDRIDLTNINSTAAQVGGVSYDPSTNITKLAITDGQHTDMLNLAGDYANSAWSFTSDGSGGTIATNSLPASGAATIAGGATLDLTGAVSPDVIFTDSTGTLVLSDPTHFTGTISTASGMLTSDDRIDLANINSTTAQVGSVSYDQSTNITKLAITDGQHADTLNLAGDYANSAWSFTNDGSSGTIVTNSLPHSGNVTIASGATLEITSASAENVSFNNNVAGSFGTLVLDH